MTKRICLLLCVMILAGCSSAKPILEATPGEQSVQVDGVLVESPELTRLWSYGLTNVRTGEPLVEEGGEHRLDEGVISYGYNLIVDKGGNVLTPSDAPLHGLRPYSLTSRWV